MLDRRSRVALLGVALAVASCSGPADATCTPGDRGCPCAAGSACEEGLVCDTTLGVCASARVVELPPIDPGARSCELLLEDDGAAVVRASFGTTVRGETIRQAPRTGVTFFSLRDAPIEGAAIHVELVGDGSMKVTRARCFDRLGHALPGGGIATDG